ncbi:hypothetical protein JRQ81_013880, partial [Phrynocephalus forsythii]
MEAEESCPSLVAEMGTAAAAAAAGAAVAAEPAGAQASLAPRAPLPLPAPAAAPLPRAPAAGAARVPAALAAASTAAASSSSSSSSSAAAAAFLRFPSPFSLPGSRRRGQRRPGPGEAPRLFGHGALPLLPSHGPRVFRARDRPPARLEEIQDVLALVLPGLQT